jgi:hypothetical protein
VETPQKVDQTLLHRILGIGVTTVAAVFLVLTYLGIAPILREPDGFEQIVAYVLSGVAAAVVAVALLVVKPRFPDRVFGHSVEEYWSEPKVRQNVLLIWFLLEGAGILAAIGFFLTGAVVSAIAMGGAIVIYWLSGPKMLMKG